MNDMYPPMITTVIEDRITEMATVRNCRDDRHSFTTLRNPARQSR